MCCDGPWEVHKHTPSHTFIDLILNGMWTTAHWSINTIWLACAPVPPPEPCPITANFIPSIFYWTSQDQGLLNLWTVGTYKILVSSYRENLHTAEQYRTHEYALFGEVVIQTLRPKGVERKCMYNKWQFICSTMGVHCVSINQVNHLATAY